MFILDPGSQILGKIIWDVNPGSRGKKKHRIPDLQHWYQVTAKAESDNKSRGDKSERLRNNNNYLS
jgi:hypothetical protein